jgi:shikimate kinase
MSAEKNQNIILCGFMGTGKSSVGKKLAELSGYDFWDMDSVIETEAGMTIPQIFSSRGEPAFRALEAGMVERITQLTGHIVATGGGTVVNPDNLKKLKECGFIITLAADIPTILKRVGSGDDRPLLKEGDREERIRSLLELRAQAYGKADITLDTSHMNIEETALHILNHLRQLKIMQ